MALAFVEPPTVARLEQAARIVLSNWQGFVAGHPELGSLNPSFLGGWSGLIAAGAYFLGSIPTVPEQDAQRRLYLDIQFDLAYLRQGTVPTAPLGQTLRHLVAAVNLWEQRYGTAAPEDASDVVPSPNVVAQLRDARLAEAVARLTVWQKAHHGRIHVPLANAEAGESAAVHPFAAAVTELGTEVVQALRTVVNHMLPEIRHELVTLIRQERELRRDADADLRADLRTRTQALAQRIGDVVRWLRTEVIPETRELVRTERALRIENDRQLHRGLATEIDERTDADLSLATQLAPLVAWASSFGVHTTEKVKRNEDLIDQLGRGDLGTLLALTSFPGLAALTVELLVRLAPHVPEVLGGLEEAAFDALGAVR